MDKLEYIQELIAFGMSEEDAKDTANREWFADQFFSFKEEEMYNG